MSCLFCLVTVKYKMKIICCDKEESSGPALFFSEYNTFSATQPYSTIFCLTSVQHSRNVSLKETSDVYIYTV